MRSSPILLSLLAVTVGAEGSSPLGRSPTEVFATVIAAAHRGDALAVGRSIPLLEPLVAELDATYAMRCGARLRAAVASAGAAEMTREAQRIVALDMRRQLQDCEAVSNRRRCEKALAQAALRYALLTSDVAAADVGRDDAVRAHFRAAKRLLGPLGPFAHRGPIDLERLCAHESAIWDETARALKLGEGAP